MSKFKKIISIIVVCSIFIVSRTSVKAMSSEVNEYDLRYSYTMNTYESTSKMLEFSSWYENSTSNEYYYPDFFAGFQILQDGTLAFLVTDDSEEVRNTIKSIVGDDISFINVNHSFNDLYTTAKELQQIYVDQGDSFFRIRVNPSDNIVDVYTDNTDEMIGIISDSGDPLFRIHNSSELETTLQDEQTTRINSLTDVESNLQEYEGQTVTRASSTTVYPGVSSQFYGYSEDILSGNVTYGYFNGTTGFCALDGNGNRVIITHGHDMILGQSFKVKTSSNTYISVGTVDKIYYTDTNTMKDFSVIKLNSGIKISNKINNSSLRITANVSSDYTLCSYNNAYGYAYGATAGGETRGTLLTVIEGNQTYLYLNGANINAGDSGAPIYLKPTTTTATLLGIVKGTNLNNPWGCSLQTIKDTYEIYVFQNNTDY